VAVGGATLTEYWERLRRYTPEQLAAAIDVCVDTHDFFPSVSQIKKAIEGLPAPRQKLLDEPRPTPKQVAEAQEMLKDMIDKSIKPVAQPKQSVEERRALLKAQAEKLLQ